MIKLIAQSEYQKKRWKNGCGTTQEIAVSDESIEFEWRMSMADIVESGPFSAFPGMDRILVLLTGSEIKISHEGVASEKSLQLLTPYQFSGDWPTSARISEKGRDFNLIYRRDKFKGSMDTLIVQDDSCMLVTENLTSYLFIQLDHIGQT